MELAKFTDSLKRLLAEAGFQEIVGGGIVIPEGGFAVEAVDGERFTVVPAIAEHIPGPGGPAS